MSKTNDEIVRHWAGSLIKSGEVRRLAGGTVRVDPDGAIRYVRRRSERSMAWGPVDLGRYVPRSRTVVLNGDGFTDRRATDWQTSLRNRLLIEVRKKPKGRVRELMVVPYAALEAAMIDVDSIIPIHVTLDETEEIWHQVPAPPPLSAFPAHSAAVSTQTTSRREVTVEGTRWQTLEQRSYAYVNPDNTAQVSSYRRTGWDYQLNPNWTLNTNQPFNVMASTSATTATGSAMLWQGVSEFTEERFAQARAQREATNERIAAGGWGTLTTGEFPTVPGWYWREQIHHLGACVFSAKGEDGRRHKFVSGFDVDEPGQMYFLAQLPDGSGAKTWDEGLAALAPPFVHEARRQGRNVRRQGDVFAVETTLSDEEVYSFAKTRVRREVVLATVDISRVANIIAGLSQWPDIRKGEVRERVDCPCHCGHKRWSGWGPKARQALSIYNTGHTADEVVVSNKGTTYIRGTMYHDPHVYEPGRAREHRNIELGPKWHVAIRNTVPRRAKRRASQSQAAESVPATV